jgi:hypothetical protein
MIGCCNLPGAHRASSHGCINAAFALAPVADICARCCKHPVLGLHDHGTAGSIRWCHEPEIHRPCRTPTWPLEGLIGAGKTTLGPAAGRGVECGARSWRSSPTTPSCRAFYLDPARYAFSLELSFLAQRYHQLKRVGDPQPLPAHHRGGLFHRQIPGLRQRHPATRRAGPVPRPLRTSCTPACPKPDLLVYLHADMPVVA